jgi:hypothetical protein
VIQLLKWLKKLLNPCPWHEIDCWVARDNNSPEKKMAFFHLTKPEYFKNTFVSRGGNVYGGILNEISTINPGEVRRCKILIEK